MMPIGPLMIEHRLIERVIQVMKGQLDRIQAGEKIAPDLIGRLTDFIKIYADRCHHGKEEDILFRDLSKRIISPEHKRIMEELVEEHKLGRKITGALIDATRKYEKGETEALSMIADGLKSLVEFYPKHIEKEDKHFFLPVMAYFSKEEKDAMLSEGYEFDSRLFHQQFDFLVGAFGTKK